MVMRMQIAELPYSLVIDGHHFHYDHAEVSMLPNSQILLWKGRLLLYFSEVSVVEGGP